jgi:outer membrane protein
MALRDTSNIFNAPAWREAKGAFCQLLRLNLRLNKIGLVVFALVLSQPACWAQASDATRNSGVSAPDYSSNPEWFPHIFAPYKQRRVPPADLANSKTLADMIHDGKIELSLDQFAAAVVENNLILAADRYNNYFAQADLLRTKAGQAARGVLGAAAGVPDALQAAAIGAGIGNIAGLGGIGLTGSISGLQRSLALQPRGAYDPTFIFNTSWDRTGNPLNTLIVAGLPAVTTDTAFYQFGWQQAFTSGTSFAVALSNQRQYSTQLGLIYDPDVITRMSVSFVQQLSNGFGFTVNRRFQLVARNNVRLVREWFLQQVDTTLAQAEESYWNLVSAQEQVRATQEALDAAQRLYEDNKKQAAVGTLAPLDVITAQSQVAASQRNLVVAQTNLQQQELTLKNFFSRQITDALGSAEVVATDPLPEPQPNDVPPLDEAIATAARNRPEVPQAETNVQNDQVAVKVSRNFLKPTFNAWGFFASAGLSGNHFITTPAGTPALIEAGLAQELNQFINFQYPEYAFGATLTIPIKNRSAQADNARATLLEQQAELSLQSTQKQVGFEVRSANIRLMQAKAQVSAAISAADFSRQSLDAEQKRLSAGISTPYNLVLQQRNLLDAELAAAQARATYANALVEMQRSMGVILEKSNISPEDAVRGQINR